MAIRTGLIGAGRLGRGHLESLTGFPDVEIAGVCDTDRSRAEDLAQPFGASVHINFRTLLEAERLDIVVVCLPAFARGEPETMAARAGIHLLLCGPVALSTEKAAQIQKQVETSGVVSSVAYLWRYLSGVERARELLKDRKIALVRGRRFGPVPVSEWRRRRESSGGQFVQEAAGLIDLARYLAGEVVSVYAMDCDGISAARHSDYDIEDALASTLRFRSGAVGEIVSANVAPVEETVLSIAADQMELQITADRLEITEAGKRIVIEHTGSAMHAAQEAFLDAVRTGRPDLVKCDYGDAARTLAVSLAAAESARTGKAIGL